MSRIAKKMILPIGLTILGVTLLAVFLNGSVVQRFTLYQQKQELEQVWQQLEEGLGSSSGEAAGSKLEGGRSSDESGSLREELEQIYGVEILQFDGIPNYEDFNDQLYQQFQSKGIGFVKLWLWDGGYDQLIRDGSTVQIYNQDKLQYSILVKYALQGGDVYAIAKNIPHTGAAIRVINLVTLGVFSAGGLLIVLYMAVRIRRVTEPLAELAEQAGDIGQMNFRRTSVHTGDEIEVLADSLNQMNDSLQVAQAELRERNQNMEDFLSNASHELKTPVALIKAYGSGIRDGMDDGTFLDVILEQNERIDYIVETLLELSRVQKSELHMAEFGLSEMIEELAHDAAQMLECDGEQEAVELCNEIQPCIVICGDENQIRTALENLMTNAVKYGVDWIKFSLERTDRQVRFSASNGLQPGTRPDLNRIWEPFYVGEKSRCKGLSGTGLGLPIAKSVLERHGFTCNCRLSDSSINFEIIIEV